MSRSEELFAQAQLLIPGGVNSPARAFKAVKQNPVFIESANGSTICDVDGNTYLDYIGSWGPMILGHNHPAILEAVTLAAGKGMSFGAATEAEVHMALLMTECVPSLEMVRMVNSGTEATMSALRVARGFTGREKIVKFEGCYHGHSNELLVRAGSGLLSGSSPDSAGVSRGCALDTLVATYNDMESVYALFESNPNEIAAVIVEPLAANMGVVPPKKGFLESLKKLCVDSGALLIFDEVITGFRLSIGGAQAIYGIEPDLSTFGKIIGGGMPVGAYGGRKEIMEVVAPLGPVYQAGTLSGNPLAMAAGIAQLSWLRDHPQVFTHIDDLGDKLYKGLSNIVKKFDAKCCVNHVGSLGSLFFTEGPVQDFSATRQINTDLYAHYFSHMLENNIYLAPAQFEAMFISAAHTDADIDRTLEAAQSFFSLQAASNAGVLS